MPSIIPNSKRLSESDFCKACNPQLYRLMDEIKKMMQLASVFEEYKSFHTKPETRKNVAADLLKKLTEMEKDFQSIKQLVIPTEEFIDKQFKMIEQPSEKVIEYRNNLVQLIYTALQLQEYIGKAHAPMTLARGEIQKWITMQNN